MVTKVTVKILYARKKLRLFSNYGKTENNTYFRKFCKVTVTSVTTRVKPIPVKGFRGDSNFVFTVTLLSLTVT